MWWASLAIVTIFYMLVAIAAVGAQPAAKFTGQEAGLAVILQNVTGKAWPAIVPLPHPSWRTNGWEQRNPWFGEDLLPALRQAVAAALEP